MSGPHALELTHLLGQLELRLSQRLRERLAAAGSSVKQWCVLSYLGEFPGRTMSEIAGFLRTPAPTTTKLIDGMVATNQVHRRSDERDRRRVVLYLTPRGEAALARLAPLVEQEQAELTSLADPRDLQELARLLTQVAKQVG